MADRWGLPTDDTVDLATLPLGFPRAGCSVAWLPANRTTTATPLLSRAFDFTTLTFNQLIGAPPQAGDEPFAGRAYILETRPPSGHATLTITAFDLLSAAVDGINDAGLVAALLSDDESTTGGQPGAGLEPTFAPLSACRRSSCAAMSWSGAPMWRRRWRRCGWRATTTSCTPSTS